MRASKYVWLIKGKEKTLVYYYENPDTMEWGFGFNIADGGGFLPEKDLTDDVRIVGAVVGVSVNAI